MEPTDSEKKLLDSISVRDKLKELQESVERDLKQIFTDELNLWMKTHSPSLVSPNATLTSALTKTHRSVKCGEKFPSRVFVARPSLLTELFIVNHFTSLYNIFVAVLLLFFTNKVIDEVAVHGRFSIDLSLITYAFGKSDQTFIIWLEMLLSTFLLYLIYHYWAYNRMRKPSIWDATAATMFFVYLILLLYLPVHYLLLYDLPPASSFIVLCEQTNFIVAVFSSCFSGSLVLLCGFFAVLHSWMNAFAEMLRFSDRMFYKDWWNSTSYARFYRTWNCVVHDWLYEYVYKEAVELQLLHATSEKLAKVVPTSMVFFISAFVHEYILAFAFRFFYPVVLLMFGGFGSDHFNIFFWLSLILGNGILMCSYSMEWYARINCPQQYGDIVDLLIPRSWFCNISHS